MGEVVRSGSVVIRFVSGDRMRLLGQSARAEVKERVGGGVAPQFLGTCCPVQQVQHTE